MKPVIIFQRAKGPVQDEALYAKLHTFMMEQAEIEQEEGADDVAIIARHTRVIQQLAANATEIAAIMGVEIDE